MDIEECFPKNVITEYVSKRSDKYVLKRSKRSKQNKKPVAKIFIKTFGCSHNYSDSEHMAGILVTCGYHITTFEKSDLVIVNSCTVKSPSESTFFSYIKKAVTAGKKVVLAGCVPQANQNDKLYFDFSVIGVQEFDRIEYVVEETLKGNCVRLLSVKRQVKQFSMPKVRQNAFIEIIPISSGCLNNCSYCATKLARGRLKSWAIPEICFRIKQAISEGVREIRITSEDVGAYGIDFNSNIVELLKCVKKIDLGDTMVRIGMTNPTYILGHLDEVCDALKHKNFYEFLHIPVQSGSNEVLKEMKREYEVCDFERVVKHVLKKVPNCTIATDVICGFPTESDEHFKETLSLIERYKFPVVNISQMYLRPGTLAFRLKKRLDTRVKKNRSRMLSKLFLSYKVFDKYVGTEQRVLITEFAHDKVNLCGRTKNYIQVLIDPKEASLGETVGVKIYEAHKFFLKGKVIKSYTHWGKKMNVTPFSSKDLKGRKKKGTVYSYTNYWTLLYFLLFISFIFYLFYYVIDVEFY